MGYLMSRDRVLHVDLEIKVLDRTDSPVAENWRDAPDFVPRNLYAAQHIINDFTPEDFKVWTEIFRTNVTDTFRKTQEDFKNWKDDAGS